MHKFFSDIQGQLTPVVGDRIWMKFELKQTLIVVLVTGKKEDPNKNEGFRVVTSIFPLYVYGEFSRHSRPKIELIRDFMVVLVTCKN